MKILFGQRHNEKITIDEQQQQLIQKFIQTNAKNMDRVNFIFELISNFQNSVQKEFIAFFIQHNDDYNAIHEIIKEPTVFSFSGSAVIYWTQRKEFYESLLELFNQIKFLRHRQYIEEMIEYHEKRITREKKREFMDD